MINMNLHQTATIVGGTLVGKPRQFKGVTTDSRLDCSGRLFIALSGERFNGEDYCEQALENGAVAILVSKVQDTSLPQIICENTLDALSIIGKNWAKQCKTKIIAITGSNGKTTVKNMVHSILSVNHQCSATLGNLNNEIGVPLTLCNIHPNDQFAVIEMGAAKLGDISWLVSLVNIHTAVITNVSSAHIGRFKTFDNIINEKGQIISTLGKDDYAVLPIDDENFALWKSNTISKIISFGNSQDADVTLDSINHINLPVAGYHNQSNAACATAIAQSCNVGEDDIKAGLEKFTPESGRLENLGTHNNNTIINDSYNANPQSVKAAIDVLATYKQPTTLVLGDMAELGSASERLHFEVGTYAKSQNISHLLTIGKHSQLSSNSFSDDHFHFKTINELYNHMKKHWDSLGTILVKGSRSMHLEDLIDSITNKEKAA